MKTNLRNSFITTLTAKAANLLVVIAMLVMSVGIPTHQAKALGTLTYSILRETPSGASTNADSLIFRVDFSEGALLCDVTDFAVVGSTTATITAGVSSAEDFMVTVSGGDLASFEGSVGIQMVGGTDITDSLSNPIDPTPLSSQSYTIDNTAPTLTVTTLAADPTNALFTANFAFSEDVTGFDISDVTVTNGTKSNFVTTNASHYTVDITPTADGAVSVGALASAAADAAGNNSGAGSLTIQYDNTDPTVAITSSEADPTNNSPFSIDIVFSEEVSGFIAGDLTVTNGSASNLQTVDNISYTADITPTVDGSVKVDLASSKVLDLAGNNNTAASQFTITYDSSVPTVVISSLEADPTNASPISISIAFSADVTGFDISDLDVTNGSASNFVTVDPSTYTADITPTVDGTVSVDIADNVAQNAATTGNLAAPTFDIVYDTTSPTLVLSAAATITNDNPIVITATFSEDIDPMTFDASDIDVTNGTADNLVIDTADSIFTFDVTPTIDGIVSISIADSVISDVAGNLNDASNTLDVEYDSIKPVAVFTSDIVYYNYSPIPVTVTFSEDIDTLSFDLSSLSITNGTASNLVLDTADSVWTFDVTPTAEGDVTIGMDADAIFDPAGNGNPTATDLVVVYDITPPVVTSITTTASDPTNDVSFPVTITWSEPVEGFKLSDIDTVNAHAGAFVQVSPSVYTITLTPTASGLVSVAVAIPASHDLATNHNTVVGDTLSLTYDGNGPTAVIAKTSDGHLSVTFNEAVTGFIITDLVATNASLSNFAGSGTTYTFDYAITNPAVVTTFSLAAGVAQDAVGNNNLAATSLTIAAVDAIAPTVSNITRVDATPTKAAQVHFTVTFNENVVNVDTADIHLSSTGTIAAASIASVTGSGSSYTVTVNTGTGSGNINIDVPVGSGSSNNIQDAAGNPMAVAFTSANPYTIDRTVLAFGSTSINLNGSAPFSSFTVTFPEDVLDPAGNTQTDDATNPNNYMLVQAGANRFYNTVSCAGGLKTDDTRILVNSVTFNHTNFTATVNINNGANLPVGSYRLFLCGTTSLVDLVGNPLNGGFDSVVDFTVGPQNPGQPGQPGQPGEPWHPQYPPYLPHTGFGARASLPANLPSANAFGYTGASLQISSLNLNAQIVSVDLTDGDWNIDALGNSLGYLSDTAALGQAGNSVITGHIYNIGNIPGPFVNLKNVKVGENITLTQAGKTYTYIVRSSKLVDDTDLNAVFTNDTSSWLTLVTCETYDYASDTYLQRRVVRAEFVSVK